MKNLNAIVWLYRCETEKYSALIREYHDVLGNGNFTEIQAQCEQIILQLREDLKNEIAKLDNTRKSQIAKKRLQADFDKKISDAENKLTIAKEAVWLYKKFGDGEYKNIPGLCKIADVSEVEAKGWSLTPGAYVGVSAVEDDGVNFSERMREIHRELLTLQAESDELMNVIAKNFEGLGL